MPRFQEPQFAANRRLLPGYRDLAAEAGCSPAQLALAWLLHKNPIIVPIPGTTSLAHLEQNVAAASIALSAELIDRLEALINERTIAGRRYITATLAEIDSEEFA
jgi:hypothetical protein